MPRVPTFLTPVRTTFIASLLLSLTAWLGTAVNRDGMLYVRVGQAFLSDGFSAAYNLFHWPFLGILMAIVAKISGLSIENAGYLVNALFMASTCALMVACVNQRQPSLTWLAALSTLAIPGLNEYRNEILREFGAWFFVMLTFWQASQWNERPSWTRGLLTQASLIFATLFRPEMATLFGALILWQIFASQPNERIRRCLMIGTLPLLGLILLATTYLTGDIPANSRLAFDLDRLSTARFAAKAELLAGGLVVYAYDNAQAILFFGSLALIPIKLISKLGFFLLPAAYMFSRQLRQEAVNNFSLFAWGIVIQTLVLSVFVLDLQFLSGRYVGLILLFSIPFVAVGLQEMLNCFPRWRAAIIIIMLIMTLANVISLSPSKTHLIDAGHWLAANVQEPTTVYIDSGRTAYHAGWLSLQTPTRNDRSAIAAAVTDPRYRLFVLEISRHDPAPNEWLNSQGLHVVQRFEHAKGDAVIVAERRAKP